MSRRFSPSAWLAALALMAFSMMAAPARSQPGDNLHTSNCSGTRYSESCVFRRGPFNPHVINVPGPTSDEERKAAAARDQRWVERCRPQLRPDRYGMLRYNYFAPDCEYGRLD